MKTFLLPCVCVSTALALGAALLVGCGEAKPADEPQSVMTRDDPNAGAVAVAPVVAPGGGAAAPGTTTTAPAPAVSAGTTTQSTTTTTTVAH